MTTVRFNAPTTRRQAPHGKRADDIEQTTPNPSANGLTDAPPPESHTLDAGDENPWQYLVEVLNEHFYNPDIQAVRAIYAATAAHFLIGQPVWTMGVAPPGSMKSTILESLDQFTKVVHSIDSLTPNTFLSGQIAKDAKKTAPSLLTRIGSGIITISDFSTILAMKHEDRA